MLTKLSEGWIGFIMKYWDCMCINLLFKWKDKIAIMWQLYTIFMLPFFSGQNSLGYSTSLHFYSTVHNYSSTLEKRNCTWHTVLRRILRGPQTYRRIMNFTCLMRFWMRSSLDSWESRELSRSLSALPSTSTVQPCSVWANRSGMSFAPVVAEVLQFGTLVKKSLKVKTIFGYFMMTEKFI